MESIQEEKNKQEQEPQTKYQFDAPQILNLFKDALSGDNAKIKEATKYLK